ncbi:MAG: hypothetical protein SPD11_14610 [Sphaerochaetaceae bacterium]|nr:hypothetical protein [Sphaerochaetaceae bacterium]
MKKLIVTLALILCIQPLFAKDEWFYLSSNEINNPGAARYVIPANQIQTKGMSDSINYGYCDVRISGENAPFPQMDITFWFIINRKSPSSQITKENLLKFSNEPIIKIRDDNSDIYTIKPYGYHELYLYGDDAKTIRDLLKKNKSLSIVIRDSNKEISFKIPSNNFKQTCGDVLMRIDSIPFDEWTHMNSNFNWIFLQDPESKNFISIVTPRKGYINEYRFSFNIYEQYDDGYCKVTSYENDWITIFAINSHGQFDSPISRFREIREPDSIKLRDLFISGDAITFILGTSNIDEPMQFVMKNTDSYIELDKEN